MPISLRQAMEQRRVASCFEAIRFGLTQLAPQFSDHVIGSLKSRLVALQSGCSYVQFQQRIKKLFDDFDRELIGAGLAKSLRHGLKELSKPKVIDRLVALMQRQKSVVRECAVYRHDPGGVEDYARHCIDDRLGLFRFIGEAGDDLANETWFRSISLAEQRYFDELLVKLSRCVESGSLKPDCEDARQYLLEVTYPFPPGYAGSPVIVNSQRHMFSWDWAQGDFEQRVALFERPGVAASRVCALDQLVVTRMGLPDEGKKGSLAQRRMLVQDIVKQAEYLHGMSEERRYKAVMNAWGLSQADFPRQHCTITLIDDFGQQRPWVDLIKKMPSDELYLSAMDRWCYENKLQHHINRCVINPPREYMPLLMQQRIFNQCQNFLRATRPALDAIEALNVEGRELKVHRNLLCEAVRAYKVISDTIQFSWPRHLAAELFDTDFKHKAMCLASLQIMICHSLGWSFRINCKSSKDRAGLTETRAVSEWTQFLKHQSFSADMQALAGCNSVLPRNDAMSSYNRAYSRVFASQISFVLDGSPAAFGLKGEANFEVRNRLACMLLRDYIVVAKAVYKMLDVCSTLKELDYSEGVAILLASAVGILSSIFGMIKATYRLFQAEAYPKIPLQDQRAINADSSGALCRLLGAHTGGQAIRKPNYFV